MPRRHAQGLRRHARVSCARGVAHDVCRDGAAHGHQEAACARREGRRLHGRRLCARIGQAGHLHGAGDRRAQSRRRPARRVAGAFAGHRDDGRARAEDEVQEGLSGDRRCTGVRAGDEVQRHDRRRRALSRHGAPGVPHGGDRLPRPGASAIPRQRGPDRRRGSGDGAAVRAAIRARSSLPPGAGRGERARGAENSRRGGAPRHRRRRRRARVGRAGRTSSRSPRRCISRSRPRSTARIRSPAIIRYRSVSPAPIRARARTASSTRPISSASSAPRPAA